MAHSGRKFKFHGAYKKKSAAVKKERSAACSGHCFILTRTLRRLGKRFLVLEKKR